MIVLISPSKTMSQTQAKGSQKPRFTHEAERLLATLRAMNETALKATFRLSDSLADQTKKLHASFTPDKRAIEAYTGVQFSALNASSLSDKHQQYIATHVRILSGLYGLVHPEDAVGLYRLPMGATVDGIKLSTFWRPHLKRALAGEVVLNLASGEYTAALDKSLALHHVKFDKAPGVHVKRLRGRLVRLMAEHTISDIDGIKPLRVDDYAFSHYDENRRTFVFRQIKT